MLSFKFNIGCTNQCAFCCYSQVFRLSASYLAHQEAGLMHFEQEGRLLEQS